MAPASGPFGDDVARLVGQGLGVAMFPSAQVPQLTGLTVIGVTDGPIRVEHVIWSRAGRTPAATAFLAIRHNDRRPRGGGEP